MGINNIKEYLFNKLIFPKVLIVDCPGIIINRAVSKFRSSVSNTRVMYNFEEIYVDLHADTVKKLGQKKTSDLWYKIGKDCGTRYSAFFRKKKFSKKMFELILKYFFDLASSVGMTFTDSFEFDAKRDVFIASGKDCIINRKVQGSDFIAGICSGVLSSLYHKNMEAMSVVNKNIASSEIYASFDIPFRYRPPFERIVSIEEYSKFNFLQKLRAPMNKFYSFTDLLRFRKVSVDEKKKLFSFLGHVIFPVEVGLPGLIMDNYLRIDELSLFEQSIIGSSERIFQDLLYKEDNISIRVKFALNIFSAFGWGLPTLKKDGNIIIATFLYPPVSRFSHLSRAFVFNGAVNSIFKSKFKLKASTNDKFIFESSKSFG